MKGYAIKEHRVLADGTKVEGFALESGIFTDTQDAVEAAEILAAYNKRQFKHVQFMTDKWMNDNFYCTIVDVQIYLKECFR